MYDGMQPDGEACRGGPAGRTTPPLDPDAAVDEEISFHLEMLERELREAGADPDEARRLARARFGDPTRIRRGVRRARRRFPGSGLFRGLVEGLGLDLKVVARQLAGRPGFTLAAVASLALGIAADAAILTLLDAYFLRPLPYEAPERLVALWETEPGSLESTTIAPGNLRDWKAASRTLDAVAGYNIAVPTVSEPGEATRVPGAVVEPGFFRVLGVEPLLGRGLDPAGPPDQVVVSHGFWQRRFGGDPGVVGRTVRVDGEPRTVVGVMPPGFRQPERRLRWARPDVWFPLDYQGEEGSREFRYLRAVGRLAPGADVEAARREMAALGARLARAWPEDNAGRTVLVRSLADEYLGASRPAVLLLAGAGALVLLLVCANLATLILARTEQRTGEFALRSALGSSRRRLVRLVLLEASVLTAAGTLLGGVLLALGAGRVEALQAARLSPVADATLGVGAAFPVAALALAAALLSGLVPALRVASPDLRSVLVGSGRSTGRHGGGGAGAFVAGETALTLVLVVTAGLLLRSFVALVSVPPGFDPRHVVVADMSAPADRYPDAAAVMELWDRILARARARPGVVTAGLTSDLPFLDENRWSEVWPEGPRPIPGAELRAEYHSVEAGYFGAMGISLLGGRTPDAGDRPDGLPVAVVNRALAERLWPGSDPVGRRMQVASGDSARTFTVVGLVGDVRDDGYDAPPERLFYRPLAQSPQRAVTLVARVRPGAEGRVSTALREAVAEIDTEVPVELATMASVVRRRTAAPRDALVLVGTFALLALGLAAVGVYGVMWEAVTARTREIGIRAALGAPRRRLLGEVLGRAARLVLAGAAVGLAAAVPASRLVGGRLFGVGPMDPATWAGAVAVLVAVGLGAAWIPARRATRIDPLDAMRTTE